MSSNSDRAKEEVAVYAGEGVEAETVELLEHLFERFGRGRLHVLPAGRFTEENLRGFDLVILPGGRGSQICHGLGEGGKDALRGYVAEGGSVLGICAGAYALSARYEWSLKLIPMQVLDTPHWRRGEHRVKLRITPAGRAVFGTDEEVVEVYYLNGPVIAPFPEASEARYVTLATFEDEVTHAEGIKGLMYGSPAAVMADYGKGTVISISPHIEESEGLEHLVINAIHYLIRQRRHEGPRVAVS